MVPIGLSALVIVGARRGLAAADRRPARRRQRHRARRRPPRPRRHWSNRSGSRSPAALVAAVVIFAVRLLVETGETSFLDSWRGMLRRFWRVVAGSAAAVPGRRSLLFITVIGIPIAICKFVCWQFVQQEILFGDKGDPRGLPRQLRAGARPLVAHRARRSASSGCSASPPGRCSASP